jgi:NACalpha-BTF3-like transcription factor
MTQLSTLQSIGANLTKAYHKEQKALRTKTTKMVFSKDSFDYELGKLQSEILTIENVKIISKALALKYGINSIDRRRKSEALWLFSNHSNIVTWLRQNPKKRFTSLTALQRAYSLANKPKEEVSTQEETLQIEDKSSEVSNVGQSEEKPKAKKKLTASDVAFETVLALDTNGISKEEFLVALKEQLELIEDNTKLDEVA